MQLLLLLLLLLGRYRSKKITSLVFYNLSIAAFVVFPEAVKFHAPRFIIWPLLVLQTGSPFFFWMTSNIYFNDHFQVRKFHWLIYGIKIFSTALFVVLSVHWVSNQSELTQNVFFAIRYCVFVGFNVALFGLSLWNAIRGFSADLVEERLRSRKVFILIAGFSSIVSFFFIMPIQKNHLPADTIYLYVFSLVLLAITYISYTVLNLNENVLVNIIVKKTPQPEQKEVLESDEIGGKIRYTMEEEEYFLEDDVTIRKLAEKTGVLEYKLRIYINKVLGYKNFNDFLNRYRIAEACKLLQENVELPVIHIAMDVGYKSLPHFNRAFKQIMNQTPTQYRKSAGDKN
ncbi:MAG: helix-turn-helix domain-containing protein [Spirochaetota bacterium]